MMDSALRKKFLEEFHKTYGSPEEQRKALVAMDILSDEEIDTIMSQVDLVNATGLIKVMATSLVWSNFSRRCTSAAMQRGYAARVASPIEGPLRELMYNTPTPSSPIAAGQLYGKTAVAAGSVSDDDIRDALQTQADIREKTGVNVRLGVVLLCSGLINVGEFFQALCAQQGFEYVEGSGGIWDRLSKDPA